MKKNSVLFLIFIFLIISVSSLISAERVLQALNSGSYKSLKKKFSDNTYLIPEYYFSKAAKSIFSINSNTSLLYKTKFKKYAKTGVISFSKDSQGQIYDLDIKPELNPLYYIERYRSYRVEKLKFKAGDGEFILSDGVLYCSEPSVFLYAFTGKIKFRLRPSSKEERITLQKRLKRDYIEIESGAMLFASESNRFKRNLKALSHSKNLPEEFNLLFRFYKKNYGSAVKDLKETWFLPFSKRDSHALILNDQNSLFSYSFRPESSPDTTLSVSPHSSHIVSYKSVKAIAAENKKEPETALDLRLRIEPETCSIEGFAKISYQTPKDLALIYLNRDMKLTGIINSNTKDPDSIRRGAVYFLPLNKKKELSLTYTGRFKPEKFSTHVSRKPNVRVVGHIRNLSRSTNIAIDKLWFISRADNFYPNPSFGFIRSCVEVTIPEQMSCLASGDLQPQDRAKNRTFTYTSPAVKGISLAIGKFYKEKTINSAIPVNIFTYRGSRVRKYLNLKKLDRAVRFLSKNYGKTCSEELNILIRRNFIEGGLSNCGMIVLNLKNKNSKRRATKGSPVMLTGKASDFYTHELAHQWWGGVISRESYAETWITEGMAQFSLLDFAMSQASENKKKRYLNKIKEWIYRYNKSGPVIYGRRIFEITENHNAYLSVVYNKSLMILYMFREIVGSRMFYTKMKKLLRDYRFMNLTSDKFIKHLAGKSETIRQFFSQWVFTRAIPEIEILLYRDNKNKIKKLCIRQLRTSMIFPVRLIITDKNNSQRVLTEVIKEKEQTINLNYSRIKSIKVDLTHTLATRSSS